MPIPEAKMRGITLASDNGTVRYVSRQVLCQFCGAVAACHIKEGKQIAWRNKTFKECEQFVPILTFRPPLHGLEGEFNTFRLGGAWFKRVRRGVLVALMNAALKEIFGSARVLALHKGLKEQMAELHSVANHLLRGRAFENPREQMLRILRNAYGKRIFEANKEVTVIYLSRLSDESPRGVFRRGGEER